MLNVVDAGTGSPVVLLHAYPCDHTMWDAQARALVEAGYRVLRPDLPGFGTSPLPDAAPSLAVMADEVFAALDALEVESFVLAGLSLGGYVAMQMLRQRPERVLALALVDTKATADAEPARAVREETAKKALAAGSLRPMAEGMLGGLLGETTRRTRPEVVEVVTGWISHASAQSAAWAMRAMAGRPDSLATLAAFDAPAVVIAGDEDTLAPAPEQELMVEALPQGRLVMIAGSGHLSSVERPAAVTDALLGFVRG